MGLDMYLFRAVKDSKGEAAPVDQGPIATWRKNWPLHSFIDKTFGGNERNPLDLDLTREQVGRIIEALRSGELKTYEERDLGIFEKAAEWLDAQDATSPRLLVYCGDY